MLLDGRQRSRAVTSEAVQTWIARPLKQGSITAGRRATPSRVILGTATPSNTVPKRGVGQVNDEVESDHREK